MSDSKGNLPAVAGEARRRRIVLDGNSMTPELLVELGSDEMASVELSEDAWKAVREGRAVIVVDVIGASDCVQEGCVARSSGTVRRITVP